MPISEPTATAVILTICGVLLAVSVLSSRASQTPLSRSTLSESIWVSGE